MKDVTIALDEVGRGEQLASECLLPLVYGELRRLAASRMAWEAGDHTLQPTALVHEAWLRLVGKEEEPVAWENRAHFFGAAAQAMRRILVDRSRRRAASKRQASAEQLPVVVGEDLMMPMPGDHILMIHESLKRFEEEDPEAARIVLLKFFSGQSSDEIAKMLGTSVRTVERRWTLAKARLFQLIREEQDTVGR